MIQYNFYSNAVILTCYYNKLNTKKWKASDYIFICNVSEMNPVCSHPSTTLN